MLWRQYSVHASDGILVHSCQRDNLFFLQPTAFCKQQTAKQWIWEWVDYTLLPLHTDHLFTSPALQSALQLTTTSHNLKSSPASPTSAGLSQPIPTTHSAFLSDVDTNSCHSSHEPEIKHNGELLINLPKWHWPNDTLNDWQVMVTGDECLELMQVVVAKIQSQVNQITTYECGDFWEIQQVHLFLCV